MTRTFRTTVTVTVDENEAVDHMDGYKPRPYGSVTLNELRNELAYSVILDMDPSPSGVVAVEIDWEKLEEIHESGTQECQDQPTTE
jgi:hypothetical protein